MSNDIQDASPVPPAKHFSLRSIAAYDPLFIKSQPDELGSTYIPVDSPVYEMAQRLYSLGYIDTAFLNMRPWTRRSLLHILQKSSAKILLDNDDEAMSLLAGLQAAVADETPSADARRGAVYGVDSVYTRLMGVQGQTLRDSYHLGQTIANDYGRPFQAGFNNISGFSTVNEAGPFSLYFRGEYQHASAAQGYSSVLANYLSIAVDGVGPYAAPNAPQATIPAGAIAAQNPFRVVEATLSAHLLGHEISGGKSDAWQGPGMGGAMSWSNNAENIYSFRINRVEPLHIPLLSSFLGPFRYDFFVGSLKGHTSPNSPYIHSEEFSFAPTSNVRIAFQRSVIWGGKGHAPVTLHTFIKSFISLSNTPIAEKLSREDPGARFSSFNFSWRLPFLSHRVTLYSDSEVHDDVTPPSAPRRAAYRPGIYISELPFVHKLDLRVEGANTDISTKASMNGSFMYFETIQHQGYTNKGYILGDLVGREGKMGQAWLTYHLSPNEWVRLEYVHKKTAKDFIVSGTTQNQLKIDVVKRIRHDVEVNAWYQYEGWKAPVYVSGTGLNKDNSIALQVTWFPKLRTSSNSGFLSPATSH